MPWSNQGGPWQGGGGGGRGPWGQGPGGGGPQPPNLEELLRRGQDRFRGLFSGGGKGGRGLLLILLIGVALWLASGFYRVQPDEQGVVLQFGEYVRSTAPGLHYHLPAPIESVETPKVERQNQINIGFRSPTDFDRARIVDVEEESLMLTGDENIVNVGFTVVWRIKDAGDYLFNIQNPEPTVKAVAESAMREIVGQSKIDDVLTEGRGVVEIQTRDLVQSTLDYYDAGIEIVRLQLQKADPPSAVIEAFRDVQRARADQERARNQAQAYANDIIPRARGEAEQIRLQAEAYRERVVAEAEGEVSRFLAIYGEYQQARELVRRRLYLETMEEVLSGTNKVILDQGAEGSGVIPYLPLPEIRARAERAQDVSATGGQPR